MTSPAVLRQQALDRARAGDDAGATRLFDEGLRLFPSDAAFANSAGNFHAGAGRPDRALALFEQALAIGPTLHEATINRAVVLPRLGRAEEAAAYLREREPALAGVPRYWTTRAAAELASGDPAAAADSYDAAIARDPANARALGGRATAALEAGQDRAVADHERALSASPGDPYLLRGYAHALMAAGRPAEAVAISGAIAAQLPGWIEGLELHATLRWAAGERGDFTSHYAAAAMAQPPTPALALSWAAMLSGVDRHAEAADVLGAARSRWPADGELTLAEAVAAGEAGDHDRAGALLEAPGRTDSGWLVARARHRLRVARPDAAEADLATALADDGDDIAAWALRDLCWRLLGDDRHHWLHGQEGLMQRLRLDLTASERDTLRATLDALHDRSAMPIGQSVKDGSQTRGALFHRRDPAILRARDAIRAAVEAYRAALPAADPAHPLLRHRDAPLRFAGSWSIRLDGQGRHATHIHPRGLLSSAAYVTVPASVDAPDEPGWLELGRPPRSLDLALPALHRIRPEEGWLALFPSTLFHGTRPIRDGRRMTIAFDVTSG